MLVINDEVGLGYAGGGIESEKLKKGGDKCLGMDEVGEVCWLLRVEQICSTSMCS